MRRTLALVYRDLIPSFIGCEGFKVLPIVDELVLSHWFCLQSRFEWHRLIQAYTLSRGFHWRFATDLVCVSPGAFFLQTFANFLHLSWSSYLAIQGLCFILVSTLRCFSGSCPVGHSCQPEHLHRSALDIDLAFASFLETFSVRVFTPSVVFTPVICASGEELYPIPSLASLFPVWLINPSSVVIVVPVPSDLFVSAVFPLVLGSP